ncbi:MAG: lysophospholipid acyltransferase family protein [Planctomycetia bacterium]|nr:lysophospholipid acyltransferase family protein [Planctomycetia bacterium]
MRSAKERAILLAGVAVAWTIRPWMASLDYKVAYYDPNIDPAYANDGKRRLYIFWHEYMQIFVYLRRHCNLAMLLSRHRDADVLEQLAHRTGFDTVRGSTNRGGTAALRQMLEKAASLHLTITPDGPRGPRRRLAPGCVWLASRLQMPIVTIGIGYDRPWRLPTWDGFAIPRPGSRARLIASGDIAVPDNLDRDGIEHYREKIELLTNRLTDDAEDWASRGGHYENESSVCPGPRHSLLYFAKPKRSPT